MLIKIKRGWEMPEREATPEHIYRDRRRFMTTLGAGAALSIGGGIGGGAIGVGLPVRSALAAEPPADPSAGLYPVKRNPAFTLDRAVTKEQTATTYNNFYEFGSQKRIWRAARDLKIRPWTVRIDGMVEQELTVDIDDLLKKMPLEERLYRHRCVEAWAMAVPWSGFPMKALVEMAKPKSGARYVMMRTFHDKSMAPGQRQFWYPWPYTEGLTIEEATNDLAFLVTGVYGKPVPRQMGAPLRLAVPWKYGFKSVKSIVSFTFTDKRDVTFWEKIQPKEYGFWANVNPDVAHPRWSQATEELIGTGGKRVATQLYNGYGEQVAHLYKDMKQTDTLFM